MGFIRCMHIIGLTCFAKTVPADFGSSTFVCLKFVFKFHQFLSLFILRVSFSVPVNYGV